MYEYRAKLVRVIDGDTVDLDVDLGFNQHIVPMRFRLTGINTPEKNAKTAEERNAALAAAAVLKGMLADRELVVRTHRDSNDKYGRYLCVVFYQGVSVNDELVKLGHAAPYDGVGAPPAWPWK